LEILPSLLEAATRSTTSAQAFAGMIGLSAGTIATAIVLIAEMIGE